jgi:hypothetical protein
VAVNRELNAEIEYTVRLEPVVFTCEESFQKKRVVAHPEVLEGQTLLPNSQCSF